MFKSFGFVWLNSSLGVDTKNYILTTATSYTTQIIICVVKLVAVIINVAYLVSVEFILNKMLKACGAYNWLLFFKILKWILFG